VVYEEPEEDEKEDKGLMPMVTIFSADGKVATHEAFAYKGDVVI
jgi:hypothetical protein